MVPKTSPIHASDEEMSYDAGNTRNISRPSVSLLRHRRRLPSRNLQGMNILGSAVNGLCGPEWPASNVAVSSHFLPLPPQPSLTNSSENLPPMNPKQLRQQRAQRMSSLLPAVVPRSAVVQSILTSNARDPVIIHNRKTQQRLRRHSPEPSQAPSPSSAAPQLTEAPTAEWGAETRQQRDEELDGEEEPEPEPDVTVDADYEPLHPNEMVRIRLITALLCVKRAKYGYPYYSTTTSIAHRSGTSTDS